MVKAYDLKDLANRLKTKGVDVAEQQAVMVYEETKQWLKDSAAVSDTPYDNLVAPFLDQLDAVVFPQIDKISPNIETKVK